MKFKKWTNWQDLVIREDSRGTHYLLQVRTRDDGKKQFKNRGIDEQIAGSYLLFHGHQGLNNCFTN